MCRFMAYHGPPMQLDELLYKPSHSIIRQSTEAREREEPLNGDGWGLGWYQPDESPVPAHYRTVRPAWSDDNMRHISPVVRTPLYFAHVRAASGGLSVQQLNCHPFVGGRHVHDEPGGREALERARNRLLFMHNGEVGAFREVKRRLQEGLPDDLYHGIRGTTDSEHAFAVVQEELGEDVLEPTTDDLVEALRGALERLERLKRGSSRPDAATEANFCISDGESVVATRFADGDGATHQSLYVGEAEAFLCEGDTCSAQGPEGQEATLVCSERLFESDLVWEKVPPDHYVAVDPDGEVRVEPLDLAV